MAGRSGTLGSGSKIWPTSRSYRGLDGNNGWSLEHAARPEAASSVVPVHLVRALPASLPRNEHRTPTTSVTTIKASAGTTALSGAFEYVELRGKKGTTWQTQ